MPTQLTTFVGRQTDCEDVRRALASTRLLTLTGPGGVGKTRLALEVADGLTAAYADGVWLVELAALTDSVLVPQTIAAAVHVPEVPGQPLHATLATAFASRHALIVLDNCEHLIAACAGIVDALLRACPGLQILATSREPLGVPGETIWLVPSLPVPDPGVAMGTDEIEASASVRLFVDRARLALPTFALGDRNAATVAEICRRLDGIPLAIELAAARLRSLGLVEIAERLDDRFRLLRVETRTVLPRQQTLRATVDWSYDLLDEPERRMLRALAVFAGGWSLEAAERVGSGVVVAQACRRHGLEHGRGESLIRLPSSWACQRHAPPHPSPLDALARLVDRSLVLADHQQGRARYRLLETIRQYALEKLHAAGEEPALRSRHCAWFLMLAEQAGPALRGPEQAVWVRRLDLEHDNLRAALAWAVARGDAERSLRMARALWRFWSYRGYLIEGQRWLDTVLALPTSGTSPALLAEVHFAAGRLTHQQGEYAAARPHFESALALAQQGQHFEIVVGALTQLGHLALNDGDTRMAHDRYAEALAHRDHVGESGEVAVALASLGLMRQRRGDYATAQRLYEEGLQIVEHLGDRSLCAYMLGRLSELALERGHYTEADAHLRTSIQHCQALGARTCLASVLERFAVLAAVHDEAERALRLAGAAAALRAEVTARPTPHESARLRSGLQRIRQQLDARASDEAWAAGLALSLEQAVEEALVRPRTRSDALLHQIRPAALPAAISAALPSRPSISLAALAPPDDAETYAEPLSQRQLEVAALVARGLTNRQIGETLVITEGTANLHVKHILRKLGFSTRAQIASWAVRQGLLSAGPAPLATGRR